MGHMKEAVENAFIKSANVDLAVNNDEDAILSLRYIYSLAVNDVFVFSHKLRPDVFDADDVVASLARFLAKETARRFEIIIKKYDEAAFNKTRISELIRALPESRRKIVRVYSTNHSAIRDCPSSFSVSDSKRYRLTKEFKNVNGFPRCNLGTLGVVNANDTVTGEYLTGEFNKYIKYSHLIGGVVA